MLALVFAMILCLALGLAVVGFVAIPARREGREVLTPKGEEVVTKVRGATETVASATVEKTGGLLTAGREKAGDLAATTRQKVADVGPRDSTEGRQAS